MKDIALYDKNFVEEIINDEYYDFYSFEKFKLEGFPWYEKEHKFYRLPQHIMPYLSEAIVNLSKSSAGGCLRFKTNSLKMGLKATYEKRRISPGMPQVSDAGFDLYRKVGDRWDYVCMFRPEIDADYINMVKEISVDNGMYEYMLNFPLYSCPAKIELGFLKDSENSSDVSKRRVEKPILFYGSSITNGASVSRPGTAYTSIVAKHFDSVLYNMGYSGNARGELIIADEIGKLDLSLFVSEFDYNVTLEELKAKHFEFIDRIRRINPNVPILLMTRPYFNDMHKEETKQRTEIIYKTYDIMRKRGDKNVYYLNNMETFDMENRSDYSIDRVHPTDCGARIMANAIIKCIEKNRIL